MGTWYSGEFEIAFENGKKTIKYYDIGGYLTFEEAYNERKESLKSCWETEYKEKIQGIIVLSYKKLGYCIMPNNSVK